MAHASGAASALSASSVFDITVDDVAGKPVPLSKYRDRKALLFVNVASE
jgi:glutathione peroxidase-family protein